MPDYSKSVIYKLYDNTNGDTYYGSTCNKLRFRIQQHKCKTESNNNTCMSKQIILNDDFTYSVVENFPCENRHELHTRERWWIENNNCVNKVIPTRTKKEYTQDNKEEYIKYHKLYREENKDYIKAQFKEYYDINKEHLRQVIREYDIKNKEQIKVRQCKKVLCDCGISVRQYHLRKHKTTARHINLMSCLPCPPSSPQPSPP